MTDATPPPGPAVVLTDAEQRRNRIAMWRSDLAEMAACSPEADLCPPVALLDSLEADVRADAADDAAARLAALVRRDAWRHSNRRSSWAGPYIDTVSLKELDAILTTIEESR